jgi:hypothetical protein
MTRKYQIKYHFHSNWTPIRAKNFIKELGIKCTNFDQHIKILSNMFGCTPDQLQKNVEPSEFCHRVFPFHTYYTYNGKVKRNFIAQRLLPKNDQ